MNKVTVLYRGENGEVQTTTYRDVRTVEEGSFFVVCRRGVFQDRYPTANIIKIEESNTR